MSRNRACVGHEQVCLGLGGGRGRECQRARAQEGSGQGHGGSRRLPSPDLLPARCPPESSHFMSCYSCDLPPTPHTHTSGCLCPFQDCKETHARGFKPPGYSGRRASAQ